MATKKSRTYTKLEFFSITRLELRSIERNKDRCNITLAKHSRSDIAVCQMYKMRFPLSNKQGITEGTLNYLVLC